MCDTELKVGSYYWIGTMYIYNHQFGLIGTSETSKIRSFESKTLNQTLQAFLHKILMNLKFVSFFYFTKYPITKCLFSRNIP